MVDQAMQLFCRFYSSPQEITPGNYLEFDKILKTEKSTSESCKINYIEI